MLEYDYDYDCGDPVQPALTSQQGYSIVEIEGVISLGNFVNRSSFKLMIRDVYRDLIKFMKESPRDNKDLKEFLIMGQPGIGKSYFFAIFSDSLTGRKYSSLISRQHQRWRSGKGIFVSQKGSVLCSKYLSTDQVDVRKSASITLFLEKEGEEEQEMLLKRLPELRDVQEITEAEILKVYEAHDFGTM